MKRVGRIVSLFLVSIMICLSAVIPVNAANVVKMTNMHYLEGYDVYFEDSLTDSYGNTYSSNILEFDAHDYGMIVYDLKGEYTKFTGTLVAGTETSSDSSMTFAIFADGVRVYVVDNFTRQTAGKEISLDVTNVNKLAFMSAEIYEDWNSYIYVADGEFTKADKPSLSYPEWERIDNCFEVDYEDSRYYDSLAINSYGNSYFDRLSLDSTSYGYAMFNLDSKYETFTCYVTPQRGASSDMDAYFYIYLDDTLVVEKTGINKTSQSIPITLDVSGAKTIKFVADSNYYYSSSYQYVWVCSTKLTKHSHTPATPVVTKDATCTEDGTESITCTVCKEVISTTTIPKKGHKTGDDWTVTKEAECDVDGEKVKKCTVCGETVETEVIPKLGHTDGDWEVTTEAQCETNGEKAQKCTVCGEVVNTQVITKTGHDAGEWEDANDGTCYKVKICKTCEEVVEKQADDEVVHSPDGEWVYSEDGVCNKVMYCSVCGEIADIQSDEEADHVKGEVIVAKEPDCNHEGREETYCDICEQLISTKTLPKTEHDFGEYEVVSGSIWVSPIEKERECSICGEIESVTDKSMAWLTPLVIIVSIIIVGGFAVITITLKMNGLAFKPSSIVKLFSKKGITDDDIEMMLNKEESADIENNSANKFSGTGSSAGSNNAGDNIENEDDDDDDDEDDDDDTDFEDDKI